MIETISLIDFIELSTKQNTFKSNTSVVRVVASLWLEWSNWNDRNIALIPNGLKSQHIVLRVFVINSKYGAVKREISRLRWFQINAKDSYCVYVYEIGTSSVELNDRSSMDGFWSINNMMFKMLKWPVIVFNM